MLPVRLLDVADMMDRSFLDDASSDGIHFDRPKGLEWLNCVFQRHIKALESDLLETALSPLVNPLFPLSLPLDPYPVAREQESTRETAQGAAGPDKRGPHRWRPKRQSHPRPKVRWYTRWWWWKTKEWRGRLIRAGRDI